MGPELTFLDQVDGTSVAHRDRPDPDAEGDVPNTSETVPPFVILAKFFVDHMEKGGAFEKLSTAKLLFLFME